MPTPMQAGFEVLAAGPDALWIAAQAYEQALMPFTGPAAWTGIWTLCATPCPTATLEAWRGASCGFGGGCNSQSGGFGNSLSTDVTGATTQVAVGQNVTVFGQPRMRFGQIYSRSGSGTVPAPDPANPFEVVTVPQPLLDPVEVPETLPLLLPQAWPPVPVEMPVTAPLPEPWQQPDSPTEVPVRTPITWPVGMPVPVVQVGPPADTLAPPEFVWDVSTAPSPDAKAEPVPPTRTPRPYPRGGPNPGRPKKGTKHRKLNVRSAAGAVWVGINAVTELWDFVGAMYGALPEDLQKPRATPGEQADAVYAHFDQIDWAEAVENFLNNAIEDAFYGGVVGKGGKAANQAAGAATGGGRAMTGHWRETDSAPELPEVEIDPNFGGVRIHWGKWHYGF